MSEKFSRTAAVYGNEAVERFKNSRVAIFGIGGVGSYTAEALLRSGIGYFDIYDFDEYELSNFNRQLYATEHTVGTLKVDAFKTRAEIINSDAVVLCHAEKVTPHSAKNIDFGAYDYVVDAIDDVEAKLTVIESALAADVPIVSAMGAGFKKRPDMLKISTIYKTAVCPLAKKVRTEARKRGFRDFCVVYSEEESSALYGASGVIGSTAFVPAAMGLIIASKVINDIYGKD